MPLRSVALLLGSAFGTIGDASNDAQEPTREALREARLAVLAKELDARIAEPSLDIEAFHRAVQQQLDSSRDRNWVQGAVGYFPTRSVKAWLEWNLPVDDLSPLCAALRPELEGHPQPAVIDFAKQMHEHGIEVLFAPVPARLEIYPEEFLGSELAEKSTGYAPNTRKFYRELVRAGVEVVDLHAAMAAERNYGEDRDSLFLRTDPHWTPRGAEVAARAVGRAILAMPGIERGPYVEGVYYFVRDASREFKTIEDARTPDGVESEPVRYRRTSDADGLPFDARESHSPILVIGDSFVNMHKVFGGDFVTYLFAEVGQKIDSISNSGGGVKASRMSLRARGTSISSKTVVVWLLSANALRPSDRWDKIDLFKN